MPELPEVETVRRGLEPYLVGRRVLAAEVSGVRTARRTSRGALEAALTDTWVVASSRRGKYLLFDLSPTPPVPGSPRDPDRVLMIHLRMSGQVLLTHHTSPVARHTHVRLRLDTSPTGASSGSGVDEVRFVDPRTFGEMVVSPRDRLGELLPELARLGPDPVAEPARFTRRHLSQVLRTRRRRIKTLLMDQRLVAGIGNIYSDEILHRARIRPTRLGTDLDAVHIARIHTATREILHDAIAAGGSSLRDAQYVDAQGNTGSYQHHHKVVERAGRRCESCQRGIIRRSVIDGRSSSWCPWCQR